MSPMVSVILPSYKHVKYLPRRIESILGQTYSDFELIIIDDCSPDNSDEVIRRYTGDPRVTYIRNKVNTGTPFSAWRKGSRMARGKYIWICESDDFAEPDFLEKGVKALEDSGGVLFYTNSNVVDSDDRVVGNTADYLAGNWSTTRWQTPFCADGMEELRDYQMIGQTVPNMSSALIRCDAFRQSAIRYLLKFKLTGDWLFIGLVMQHGKVVFDPASASNFRQHQNTARIRVKSDRSQAEFILTKYYLHKVLKRSDGQLLLLLHNDIIRHIYEDATDKEVAQAMLRIAPGKTLILWLKLGIQFHKHPEVVKGFKERREEVKRMRESS